MINSTPWVSTIRVFKVDNEEVIMLRRLYGSKKLKSMTCSSMNFAAACGNEIIHNLVKGNRNGK